MTLLGGKRRKDDLDSFHAPDVPKAIGEAMGGRQFFFEIGAKAIHRIGLFKSLGWILPFGEAKDGIDQIRITEDCSGALSMQFGKFTPSNGDALSEFTLIGEITGLGYPDLRTTYDQNTRREDDMDMELKAGDRMGVGTSTHD